MGIHRSEGKRSQGNPEGGRAQEDVILLPLFPQELALVRKALRALSVFGDERDIRINIESAIDRCHRFDAESCAATIEGTVFE
jgi:hypothetical protein